MDYFDIDSLIDDAARELDDNDKFLEEELDTVELDEEELKDSALELEFNSFQTLE